MERGGEKGEKELVMALRSKFLGENLLSELVDGR